MKLIVYFYVDADGVVNRHLPLELDCLINSLYICTSDVRLNEMISSAIDGIKKQLWVISELFFGYKLI